MIAQKKTHPFTSFFSLLQTIRVRHHCGWGLLFLILSIFSISLLCGVNLENTAHIFVADQVATDDVIATRNLRVEDIQATKARQRQVALLQPPVYDLDMEAFYQYQDWLTELLRNIGGITQDYTDDTYISQLREYMGADKANEILPDLAKTEVQNYLLHQLLPFMRNRMAEGLVSNARLAHLGPSGVIVHNLASGSESLLGGISTLPDVPSLLSEIDSMLRQHPQLALPEKRAINTLIRVTIPHASLTLNTEATQKRKDAVMASIEPVFYQIQKGEILVRKGDRVSYEQQIKLQALFQASTSPIKWDIVTGTFLCALFLSLGFFVAPSGKPGTPLQCKDMILISLLLIIFCAGAWGMFLLAQYMDDVRLSTFFAALYPVAGGVGLVTMVFAARRYCTMGLLLALFGTMLFQVPWTIFFYYFLSSMFFTWLVANAQNRQDVVWATIPLSIGQCLFWTGAALLAQIDPSTLPQYYAGSCISSVLSLILLFALSPILEMLFGYSTRFRLMELMSLEQPLMQDLMVTAPGTYHHSLIVANMVEAGAKAIGANSLLCKVAALYHDIGKLTYPEYFIENQFGGPNKHDKLAPSMSALILLSHTKKGVELAEQYRLGSDICDIIAQHHGTRIMHFFYDKAIKLGESPQEAEYRYPGPRPQTKESAILMLADSVEASSRTLVDPTPARIQSHIDTIVKGIFAEGQLDESELTFKELHHLSENFQRILTGLFHQRIAYPESKATSSAQSKNPTKNI